MAATPPQADTDQPQGQVLLSTTGTVLLATTLGLCGGYLDLAVLVFLKYFWNDLRYFWTGSDFPWSVPVVHAFLLGVAGAIVAIVNRFGPWTPMRLRAGAWLFATFAIWSALLRVPLYGVCTLLLAAGDSAPVSTGVVAVWRRRNHVRYSIGILLGVLIVLVAASSGLRGPDVPLAGELACASQRCPQRCAHRLGHRSRPSVSLYGYDRDNTPNLRRWAKKGGPLCPGRSAPAPWTYPVP